VPLGVIAKRAGRKFKEVNIALKRKKAPADATYKQSKVSKSLEEVSYKLTFHEKSITINVDIDIESDNLSVKVSVKRRKLS
jgi:hypothetical protein